MHRLAVDSWYLLDLRLSTKAGRRKISTCEIGRTHLAQISYKLLQAISGDKYLQRTVDNVCRESPSVETGFLSPGLGPALKRGVQPLLCKWRIALENYPLFVHNWHPRRPPRLPWEEKSSQKMNEVRLAQSSNGWVTAWHQKRAAPGGVALAWLWASG